MKRYIIQSKPTNDTNTWADESQPLPLKKADQRIAERLLRCSVTNGKPNFTYRIIEIGEK